MTLRGRISMLLLASAVVAATPVEHVWANEAPADSSEHYAPRMIDPTSPGGGEPGDKKSDDAPVAAEAAKSVPTRPAETKPRSDRDGDVMNQPAVDDIELQMNADVLRYIAFFTGGEIGRASCRERV